MSVIDLASGPLRCAQVVVCLDRSIPTEDSKTLLKNLQWIGFELITLDLWTNTPLETSDKWILLGMEL